MPKFRISYTTEDWWNLDVEADNIDDAMEKFHYGEYNHSDAVLSEGGYLQDSVDIRPLED
jgi:hypothetical protein